MNSRNRKGSILLVLLLLLPIIILVVGFSVDLAHMHRVRTELRSATDLAAKAGADSLSTDSDENLAWQKASEIALLNKVNSQPLNLAFSDVLFGRSEKLADGTWDFNAANVPKNAMKVTGSRMDGSPDGAVRNYFGLFYGVPTFEPSATAVAAFVDLDICIVLDRSSSMKLAADDPTTRGLSSSSERYCSVPYADSRWTALANAIDVFVQELGSSNAMEQVAVVTFASDLTSSCGETNQVTTVDQDLTFTLSNVTDAMDERSAEVWNGNTDIEAGVIRGHQVLTSNLTRPNAEKVMIVFTDGRYTEAAPAPAGAAAHADSITIHTVTFSPGANQADMQALATAGDGTHSHADDAADLNAIFKELAASLSIIVQ